MLTFLDSLFYAISGVAGSVKTSSEYLDVSVVCEILVSKIQLGALFTQDKGLTLP